MKLLLAILLGVAMHLPAALIIPTGVTASGGHNNNASLIIDNTIPSESSQWNAATNVWWSGTSPTFTIDLGGLYQVQDLLASVDNNDRYLFTYSTDNATFLSLTTIETGYGEIGGGMDTMTTISSHPEYIAALAFSPVTARYIRVSAAAGDNMYSIGEVQVFGDVAGVPEPSSMALFSLGAVLLAARLRRH